MAPAAVRPPVLPKGMLVPGADGEARLAVILPHDPEYAALPGEAAPMPERARDLPQRMVRDGVIWRPCGPGEG